MEAPAPYTVSSATLACTMNSWHLRILLLFTSVFPPVSLELKLVLEAPAPYTVSGAPGPVQEIVADPDACDGVAADEALLAEAATKSKTTSTTSQEHCRWRVGCRGSRSG